MKPALSVIIPVFNGESTLGQCLADLRAAAANLPIQCIVADDGSTDSSAAIARKAGFEVVQTVERRGPAGARNLGVASAEADLLLFIDADVCVHRDTLRHILDSFESDPEMDALIGSYDDTPAAQDFLSLYKNLMHCFIHQTARREASTFWSGCGAIRKSTFLEHSGFDESFTRPAIEDIELGYRLRQAGRKMVLDPKLQVKHLKRWTLGELIKTDILNRGIPWTELILRDRSLPNDLNVQLSQRVSVALAFLLLATGTGAAIKYRDIFLLPLFSLLMIALGTYWLDAMISRSRFGMMIGAIATVAIAWRAWTQQMHGVFLAVVTAYALPFLRHRYALSPQRRIYGSALLFMILATDCAAACVYYLPQQRLTFLFFTVLLALIALNNSFYLFLAARRGRFFAVAAIPFHLLYHFYNGVSFVAGVVRYAWFRARKRVGV